MLRARLDVRDQPSGPRQPPAADGLIAGIQMVQAHRDGRAPLRADHPPRGSRGKRASARRTSSARRPATTRPARAPRTPPESPLGSRPARRRHGHHATRPGPTPRSRRPHSHSARPPSEHLASFAGYVDSARLPRPEATARRCRRRLEPGATAPGTGSVRPRCGDSAHTKSAARGDRVVVALRRSGPYHRYTDRFGGAGDSAPCRTAPDGDGQRCGHHASKTRFRSSRNRALYFLIMLRSIGAMMRNTPAGWTSTSRLNRVPCPDFSKR